MQNLGSVAFEPCVITLGLLAMLFVRHVHLVSFQSSLKPSLRSRWPGLRAAGLHPRRSEASILQLRLGRVFFFRRGRKGAAWHPKCPHSRKEIQYSTATIGNTVILYSSRFYSIPYRIFFVQQPTIGPTSLIPPPLPPPITLYVTMPANQRHFSSPHLPPTRGGWSPNWSNNWNSSQRAWPVGT